MTNYELSYNPFFDFLFPEEREISSDNMMKTDIIENKDSYVFLINVPSINKEDIRINLENGYLEVRAKVNESKDNNVKYILHERRGSSYSRSFFVGNDIKKENINAKLDNGVLRLDIVKPNKEEIESNHYIKIN